jgi:ATP-binding cassette, subfamily B, bacterial
MALAPTRTTRRQPREAATWRAQLAALRYVPKFIQLLWQTHRGYTAAMALLRLLRAVIPLAMLWVGKLIIDAVVDMREAPPDFSRLWQLVALEIVIVLVGEILARASVLVQNLLGELFSTSTSLRVMEHAATLDLYHFEDPTFYDRLEQARRQTSNRIGLLAQLLTMGQDMLTLVSLGAALFVYSPWLLLILAVTVLPSFLGEMHFAALEYALVSRWTPARRQLDYLRYVGASDETIKEVQLFGLAPWLVGRYRRLSEHLCKEHKRLSIRKGSLSTALSILGTLGYYAAYLIILVHAVQGIITLGSLTFLTASFARCRELLQHLLLGASGICQQCLYLKDLFDFFETKPSISSLPGAPAAPRPIRHGVVFEDVGFRYPGRDAWALRHVNFRLHPDERLAFVGENGAGKTTLIKLLARLYDPTEGHILLDGVDLRDYDLPSVRQAVGVIFQDFVRYDLRFDENIGVGEIEAVRSYLDRSNHGEPIEAAKTWDTGPPNSGTVPVSIIAAAEQSLATSLLPGFSVGYRQMLGRRFDRGVELSGGEWQKIALARAYIRDAQVLILDEPTASLDARAEYDVFLRFSHLVTGKMAVIISHRFSTVRMADRIIVLQHGTVVEDGTHEALVAQGGLYATLFALQAEGYR